MKNTFNLLTLLLLTAFLSLKAQDVPPAGTPYLELTVQANTNIEFDLGRAGEDGPIWIDAGDGNYTLMNITYNWYGVTTIHTLGDYLRIYGSLRNFELLNQNVSHIDVTQMSDLRYLDVTGNWLNELDLSQNYNMEKLYFNYNHLTEMDLSHCAGLMRLYARQNSLTKLLVNPTTRDMEIIYCDGNLLDACALDSLYMSMPINSISASLVLAVNGDGDNPGNLTSHTSIATEKGWQVLKWVSSGVFDPIVGDGSGCELIDEPPAGTPALTMTVEPNQNLNLLMGRAGETGKIWIDAGNGQYTSMIITTEWDPINVTSVGNYVKIYGSIAKMEAISQNINHLDITQMTEMRYFVAKDNNLTEIDLTHNQQLQKLSLDNNEITELDLSNIASLQQIQVSDNQLEKLLVSNEAANIEFIYCDGNLLDACVLDSLYRSLPTSSNNPYLFLEVDGEGTNPGNATSTTTIATGKGWNVAKWASSGNYDPIVGDGTGCYDNVGEISSLQFTVFPNPASTEINIQCDATIQSVEIVNFLGQVIATFTDLNQNTIQLQGDYQLGMYLLKIKTVNGSATQKIMIQ